MFQGAWRFAVVSVLAFGVWAEGPRGQSEGALYATCAVAFLLFSHLMMRPLLHAPDRLRKFSKSFIPAFLAYALIWSACWFLLRSRLGEVLGSVLGCAVFAWVVGKVLGAKNGYGGVIAVMIIAHSIGYFLGGFAFEFRRNPPDFMAGWNRRDILKLAQYAWGLFYGLGFGAGIGYAYQLFQARDSQPSQSAPLPS